MNVADRLRVVSEKTWTRMGEDGFLATQSQDFFYTEIESGGWQIRKIHVIWIEGSRGEVTGTLTFDDGWALDGPAGTMLDAISWLEEVMSQ